VDLVLDIELVLDLENLILDVQDLDVEDVDVKDFVLDIVELVLDDLEDLPRGQPRPRHQGVEKEDKVLHVGDLVFDIEDLVRLEEFVRDVPNIKDSLKSSRI